MGISSTKKNMAAPISLSLLTPGHSIPVQSWRFLGDRPVRVGRAPDNDVVIYSAVVSRYHLEFIHRPGGWRLMNIGANGTYLDGDREYERIDHRRVEREMTFNLAGNGPIIRVQIGDRCEVPHPIEKEKEHWFKSTIPNWLWGKE